VSEDPPEDYTVDVDNVDKLGEFANAFRVVEEIGPDCFLDFLLVSNSERHAKVVSRIRVRRAFLPAIRKMMQEAISSHEELDALPPTGTN